MNFLKKERIQKKFLSNKNESKKNFYPIKMKVNHSSWKINITIFEVAKCINSIQTFIEIKIYDCSDKIMIPMRVFRIKPILARLDDIWFS